MFETELRVFAFILGEYEELELTFCFTAHNQNSNFNVETYTRH